MKCIVLDEKEFSKKLKEHNQPNNSDIDIFFVDDYRYIRNDAVGYHHMMFGENLDFHTGKKIDINY